MTHRRFFAAALVAGLCLFAGNAGRSEGIYNPGGTGGLSPAGSNLNFYVTAAGNDNNPCNIALPCRTLQRAANLAATYNYQNLYSPTINMTDGSYPGQTVLPALANSVNSGTIVDISGGGSDAVIFADTGTDYALTVASGAQWLLHNVTFGGTFGGIHILTQGVLSVTGHNDFGNGGSAISQYWILNEFGGTFSTDLVGGTQIFVSVGAKGFIFTRGLTILNTSQIAVLNALTFTQYITADSTGAFIGAVGTLFIANNFGGSLVVGGLGLTSGAFFECSDPSGTTVDGVAMTSLNFPGHGTNSANNFEVDSRNQCDNNSIVATPSSAGTVNMADGQLNLVLNPAGNLTSLTVNLPPTNAVVPWSHQVTISNSSAFSISSLTIGGVGKTVNGAPSSLATHVSVRFQFDATTLQWYVQ